MSLFASRMRRRRSGPRGRLDFRRRGSPLLGVLCWGASRPSPRLRTFWTPGLFPPFGRISSRLTLRCAPSGLAPDSRARDKLPLPSSSFLLVLEAPLSLADHLGPGLGGLDIIRSIFVSARRTKRCCTAYPALSWSLPLQYF